MAKDKGKTNLVSNKPAIYIHVYFLSVNSDSMKLTAKNRNQYAAKEIFFGRKLLSQVTMKKLRFLLIKRVITKFFFANYHFGGMIILTSSG